ncbi:hypothetical protein OAM15_04700, partial [Pelagibacteraceae bacterium]|nr:hypothetical protein [Pelagibacteraceae bacterium]
YDTDSYLDKKFFSISPYRKIKHQLILDIVKARLEELIEICYEKNSNLNYFRKNNNSIYVIIERIEYFQNIKFALQNNKFINQELILGKNEQDISLLSLNGAVELISKGWEKEAIPLFQSNKSIISTFFSRLFN